VAERDGAQQEETESDSIGLQSNQGGGLRAPCGRVKSLRPAIGSFEPGGADGPGHPRIQCHAPAAAGDPLLGYALAPEKTVVEVQRFRAWLSRSGRRMAIIGAVGIGVLLVARAVIGLLT
jgi:hypothetical protein